MKIAQFKQDINLDLVWCRNCTWIAHRGQITDYIIAKVEEARRKGDLTEEQRLKLYDWAYVIAPRIAAASK